MASFPTTLKNFISKLTGGVTEASHINDLQDEVSALETKVGVNNSSVTTSLDYLVKNTASVNPGHKHTLAGALTDVAVTSPTNGQALAYNTTTSKWENTSVAVNDASTTVKGVTKLSVAPVTASDPIAVGTNDTRLADTSYANKGIVRLNTDANTSGLTVSSGVVSVNTGTGANQIVKLEGSGRLPAVDGSNLTNISSATFSSSGVISTPATSTTILTQSFPAVPVGKSAKVEILIRNLGQTLNNTGIWSNILSVNGTSIWTIGKSIQFSSSFSENGEMLDLTVILKPTSSSLCDIFRKGIDNDYFISGGTYTNNRFMPNIGSVNTGTSLAITGSNTLTFAINNTQYINSSQVISCAITIV
jgi:hypothetical protein